MTLELETDLFERMPKAELHMHLDGALSQRDILELARKHGVELPGIDELSEGALNGFYEVPPGTRYNTLEQFDVFLRKFGPPIAIMQTADGLRDAAQVHVQDLARQNYVYAETRFAPQYHTGKGLSLEDVIGNTLEGLERGHAETGTLVKLIVGIGRECEPEKGIEIAQAAMQFEDRGVVALDLTCNEAAHPPEKHGPAFSCILGNGSALKSTLHAGEFPVDDKIRLANIQTALRLSANGIGHGIPLGKSDGDLLKDIRSRKVRIESCPVSNFMTGAIGDLRELALDVLLREGISVSLNTDDPLMFGTSLADVYQMVCEAYGFGVEEVRAFMRNAVMGAFCTESEKDWIFKEFQRRGMDLQ